MSLECTGDDGIDREIVAEEPLLEALAMLAADCSSPSSFVVLLVVVEVVVEELDDEASDAIDNRKLALAVWNQLFFFARPAATEGFFEQQRNVLVTQTLLLRLAFPSRLHTMPDTFAVPLLPSPLLLVGDEFRRGERLILINDGV
jgi:hypothetical protein